jgi:predicted ATP-dependent endonuclease of OLD family
MFLGLDRRFFANAPFGEDWSERRRRELMLRRHWEEAPTRGAATASLAETNYLVISRMQEIRAAQEDLDDNLRRKILARALEYKPSDISNTGQVPSRQELDRYRERLSHIERAAEDLRLPVPELKTTLTDFFERMHRVVNSLEQGDTKKRKPDFEKDIIDWITNKPQADRILEHLRLLDQYRSDRLALRKAVDKFLELVNSFLIQTGKEVQVTNRGDLAVVLKGSSQHRSIGALSSGERQLLVMLAHLSLNTNLEGSGVFIIDEPELSLHIDWQERIVDAIREANPNVQLIMATHSPAIILDRVEHCRTLS